MEKPSFDVPILLLIFNRPDVTEQVFKEVRKLKPAKLFISADGPRANRPDDAENCRITREVITEHIDWQCEVQTLFQSKNLGCKYAVVAGLDWFFEQVEEGIVLEDDDIPDPSFFLFCKELLEKYRNDPRVMTIEGTSIQDKNPRFKNEDSYYFSRMPMGWGWAGWRRSWKLYDVEIKDWPEVKAAGTLREKFANPGAYERFARVWDDYYDGKINSYDGQMVFAFVKNDGVSITPNKNLVANIGFGAAATHLNKLDSKWANMQTFPVAFPLRHPKEIVINKSADDYLYREYFKLDKKLHHRMLRPFKNAFPGIYSAAKRILKK